MPTARDPARRCSKAGATVAVVDNEVEAARADASGLDGLIVESTAADEIPTAVRCKQFTPGRTWRAVSGSFEL